MTDRERWIVYPLLLLALGASLRNKLTRSIDTDTVLVDKVLDAEKIQCRRLTLTNEDGKPLMAFGPNRDGTFGVIEAKQGAINIDGPVRAKSMLSEEVSVITREGKRCMTLNVAHQKKSDGKYELQGGRLLIHDKDGKVVGAMVSPGEGRSCEIVTQSADEKKRVVVSSSRVGGIITLFEDSGKTVILGHVEEDDGKRSSGMFTFDSKGLLKQPGSTFDRSVVPKNEEKPNPEDKDDPRKPNDQGPMSNDQ